MVTVFTEGTAVVDLTAPHTEHLLTILPLSSCKLTEKMCRVLYIRLKDQKYLSKLARLMNVSPESLHNDMDWEKELYSWLFLSDDNTVSSFVVGMVDQIGSFSADIIKPPLSFEMATDKTVLHDNRSHYHGMTGLQTAVLRFLGNVIERKGFVSILRPKYRLDHRRQSLSNKMDVADDPVCNKRCENSHHS